MEKKSRFLPLMHLHEKAMAGSVLSVLAILLMGLLSLIPGIGTAFKYIGWIPGLIYSIVTPLMFGMGIVLYIGGVFTPMWNWVLKGKSPKTPLVKYSDDNSFTQTAVHAIGYFGFVWFGSFLAGLVSPWFSYGWLSDAGYVLAVTTIISSVLALAVAILKGIRPAAHAIGRGIENQLEALDQYARRYQNRNNAEDKQGVIVDGMIRAWSYFGGSMAGMLFTALLMKIPYFGMVFALPFALGYIIAALSGFWAVRLSMSHLTHRLVRPFWNCVLHGQHEETRRGYSGDEYTVTTTITDHAGLTAVIGIVAAVVVGVFSSFLNPAGSFTFLLFNITSMWVFGAIAVYALGALVTGYIVYPFMRSRKGVDFSKVRSEIRRQGELVRGIVHGAEVDQDEEQQSRRHGC